jgi:hypothetical protein
MRGVVASVQVLRIVFKSAEVLVGPIVYGLPLQTGAHWLRRVKKATITTRTSILISSRKTVIPLSVCIPVFLIIVCVCVLVWVQGNVIGQWGSHCHKRMNESHMAIHVSESLCRSQGASQSSPCHRDPLGGKRRLPQTVPVDDDYAMFCDIPDGRRVCPRLAPWVA